MTMEKKLSGTWAQFAECMQYPFLPPNAEGYFRAHYSKKPIKKELLADLYMEGEVKLGSQKFLLPVYDIMLRVYRETLNPKVGCHDQIFGFLQNLLYLTHKNKGKGLQLDVMDYIWEELWTGIISCKAPVFAPYIMMFICDRYKAAKYGNLLEHCGTTAHKVKELRMKPHPSPPGAPTASDSEEDTTDEEYTPMDAPKGWFARTEAKLAKSFCLNVDINKRQYHAHKKRKEDKKKLKLMMKKMDIDVSSNGCEENITDEDMWISAHCMSQQDYERLGMPGPSHSQQANSEDEDDDGDESSEAGESGEH